jgi:GWxTD domain-containing protein
MMQVRTFSRLFIFLFFTVSCFSVRDISSSNMSAEYRGNEKDFHPDFIAFNESDTVIKLFVRLQPSEFLFARQPDDKFRAFITIHADLINSYEDTKVLDSASAIFSFDLSEKDSPAILSVSLPARSLSTFLIRCQIIDNTPATSHQCMIPLDHVNYPSRNDFLVTDLKGDPVFRYYLSAFDTVRIRYRNESVNSFRCRYYNRNFPLAAPPFSFDVHDDFDYTPDSVFSVSKEELEKISFPQQGFYHIQTDTASKAGLTLFRFSAGFPDVTSPKQMIDALRYLTSKKEFEELNSGESPKSMVDNFWLTHGGNEEKTRILIRKYYGRVREANKFFSSYTEGWRTDRGMIYVIFGSPGTVYRSNESESWTYGTPNSSLALNFFFIKVNNPFTENDFTLSRSPTYESNWYRAVEIWRQGRPYNSFY